MNELRPAVGATEGSGTLLLMNLKFGTTQFTPPNHICNYIKMSFVSVFKHFSATLRGSGLVE